MKSQKVLVAGTGKSGIAAAKLILALGGQVVLYDSNEKLDAQAIRAQFQPQDKLRVLLGNLIPAALLDVDLAVISPGIPLDVPFVKLIDEAKIPIWGEIELAYQAAKGKLAAITGTNGKTTTTSLVGSILRAHFADVHVVGNIGNPYTAEALETDETSVTVAEISSFQLETIMDFHPQVSAITNITPDHLDRHKTMRNYIRTKESITLNQTEDDVVVLNYEDEELRRFGRQEDLKPKVVFFSSAQALAEGFYLKEDVIHYAHEGKDKALMAVSELQLLGRHNYENVMCAMAVCLHMGVPMAVIVEACRRFQAVEHRIEFVRERYGVRYYNDSKGTNPDAAIQALRAMPGPVLLIGGGYDKHSEYDEWVKEFKGRVRYLVLIGQTRDKIAACAKKYGFTDIMYAEDMDEAVKVCATYAETGDYVLLSPACASWGMFKNYEERGRIFKELVRAL